MNTMLRIACLQAAHKPVHEAGGGNTVDDVVVEEYRQVQYIAGPDFSSDDTGLSDDGTDPQGEVVDGFRQDPSGKAARAGD